VNVASPAPNPANSNPMSITINGANDASVINLGAGADTVVVGSASETVHGGGGKDLIEVTAATIGATIDGGAGPSVLELTTSGAAVMGANITGLHSVLLTKAASLTANGLSGLTITGSSGADAIIAGGTGQTLTGGAGADVLTGYSGGGDRFVDKTANLSGDTIANFAASGDQIDFTDMKFMHLAVHYANGVLSVTNGVLLASITMPGNFVSSGFHAVSDGLKGTLVTYTAPPQTPNTALFAQAAAGFSAARGPATVSAAETPPPAAVLALAART
jgi:Ca2+-binding RTX toxin-like protein